MGAGREADVVLVTDDYEVIGATLTQLRERTALLGPLRFGRRHAAYTEWELRWSYAHRPYAEGWSTAAVSVVVTVTRSLPRWSPLPSAEAGLPAQWAEYLAALTLHEEGHVAIAREAGRAVRASLGALPPRATKRELDELARSTVTMVTEAHRAEERAYDEATGHGATQGCW